MYTYIHSYIELYVHTYLHSGDVIFLPLSQSHVCISGVEVCFAFNAGAAVVGQVAVRGRHATYAVVVIQTCNNNTCKLHEDTHIVKEVLSSILSDYKDR